MSIPNPNVNMPQKQEVQSQVPFTEQFRRNLYEEKEKELTLELQKYNRYCVKSRDLENLLKLHNFLIKDSFNEIKSIYDKFMKRVAKDSVQEEIDILEKTFELLFLEHSLDFFNEFVIRIKTIVPESDLNTKENYVISEVEVVYTGQNEEKVIVPAMAFKQLLIDINSTKVKFEDIKKSLLSHDELFNYFSNAIYNTLDNPNIAFNTIVFDNGSKKLNHYNAHDFNKLKQDGTFKKLLKDFQNVQLYTELVQN